MELFTIISFAVLALGCQAFKSYNGYKTFRIYPANETQLRVLDNLEQMFQYDFWTLSRLIGKPADVMVAPEKLESFHDVMKTFDLKYNLLIENVEDTITRNAGEDLSGASGLAEPTISFNKFERYITIVWYMRDLATKYPHVTLFDMGTTFESRVHLGVKISSGGSGKPAILVDAGIHAREWMAPAQGLYIINQLAENPAAATYFKNVDWYIVPVMNPDGYEYTHTDDRFWRKTRSFKLYKTCKGVDPNRNFGYHWNEIGTSNDECANTYAGPKAFSEYETRNLRDFAANIKNLKLYLTFHSYGSYILYPWGWTSKYPANRVELDTLALNAIRAIQAIRGTCYFIGSVTNVLYPAAGGSIDYMMGVLGVPLVYAIELPDGGNMGFDPPPSDILPVVKETWEGVKVFANYINHCSNCT